MVRTTIPIRVEDPLVAARCGLQAEDRVRTSDERFFLSGPVAERVAIIDRDPATGQLAPLVPWLPDPVGTGGQYQLPAALDDPGRLALSVFGTVLETLELFEREDVLGHQIRWAFDSPQLLVVPRAGIWDNAFYDRYSRSLQFFSFGAGDRLVHTAWSRDIVAHETGHAIVDALLPAFYDALTPETLALHEALGDLTAAVMALKSPQLRDWLVRQGKADLRTDNPIAELATQFGVARQGVSLRNLRNDRTMASVGSDEPHALCEVLTGAVWAAMVHQHGYALEKAAADQSATGAVLGRALGITADRMARILFRALDYLPPAEATFADYARAVLCADTIAVREDHSGYRAVLQAEFERRGIVTDRGALACSPPETSVRVDLASLLESDWAAYAFAEQHRTLLGIPPRVPFRLFPRYRVRRRYYVGAGERVLGDEVVFRVSWEQVEPQDLGSLGALLVPGPLPPRAVFHGTTLVLGGRPDPRGAYPVLACLTTDRGAHHVAAREAYLRRLVAAGAVEIAPSVEAFRRTPLAPVVFGRLSAGMLRLRGVARLLHLAGEPA